MGRENVQHEESTNEDLSGWREGTLAAALTGATVLVVLSTVPASRGSHTAALLAAVAGGVLLLVAALTFYFHWLTTPSRRHAWTVTTMVVLASQVLVSSGLSLAQPDAAAVTWGRVVDLLATILAVVLVSLGSRSVRLPQPLLLGVGLGLALTALRFIGPAGQFAWPPSSATAIVLTVAGHLILAAAVLRDRGLIGWARRRLALTVVLVGLGHVAASAAYTTWPTDVAYGVTQVGAGVLWASATFVLLRDALATQHRRSIRLEGSLLEIEASLRGRREQLHEIRSTVAGAASASRLLDDPTIGAAMHARLERSIRSELDRLERLVIQQDPPRPGPVDLDETLDVLLESHRAQGRTIDWEPSGGATVHARPDDVTEALNILLDNAATHGGAASKVAVTNQSDLVEIAVIDEGPGVPAEAREQIFDWGVHRSDSPGEGIGLSVARRLVTEHGGSLTLATASADQGSSFVIRLPAARRSEDDHVRESGQPA